MNKAIVCVYCLVLVLALALVLGGYVREYRPVDRTMSDIVAVETV